MENNHPGKTIETLYRELSDIMREYAECIRRDDFFEIKRKHLGRIRQIEKEIMEYKGEVKNELANENHL